MELLDHLGQLLELGLLDRLLAGAVLAQLLVLGLLEVLRLHMCRLYKV